VVEPDCTIPGYPELFVLGDAAAHQHDGAAHAVPAVSPAAIQMGQYAAKAIRAAVAGKSHPPFRYWNKGELSVIGRGQAVANFGRVHFGGFFAWLTWIFVHIVYLIG